MAEYIERRTAIAKLTALEVTEPNTTMTDAKRLLADMPAADVAPVVRCKDCALCTCDQKSGVFFCAFWPGRNGVLPGDFCSRGRESKG